MCFSWTYWFPSSDIVERSNLGGAFLSAPDPVSSWRLSEIINQHEGGLSRQLLGQLQKYQWQLHTIQISSRSGLPPLVRSRWQRSVYRAGHRGSNSFLTLFFCKFRKLEMLHTSMVAFQNHVHWKCSLHRNPTSKT